MNDGSRTGETSRKECTVLWRVSPVQVQASEQPGRQTVVGLCSYSRPGRPERMHIEFGPMYVINDLARMITECQFADGYKTGKLYV